jgi:soluble lytic murein transglycosylase
MHRWHRPSLVLLALLALAAANGHARADDPMPDVRADRWPEAQAAAAREADPVAAKLVTYYRLLAPGQATVSEIAAFMADSPDWPLQTTLGKRRDEALATEADDATAATQCDAGAALSSRGWERCAVAYATRPAPAARNAAVQAWDLLPGNEPEETRFLGLWGNLLDRQAQMARFDRLAGTDTAAATRQEARLDPADRPAADARLALRRDDPNAPAMVAALPSSARTAPMMVLEQARYLRRAGQDDAAAKLWATSGHDAETAAPADQRAAFWNERNLLARQLLRGNDAASAYAVAAGHAQTAEEKVADAEFLAGFIALRKLNDPAKATAHFQRLAALAPSAITQSRAHYWLARAAATPEAARREYQAAAAYPSTYYGQLAALALGDTPDALARRIAASRDPAWSADQALAFAGRELARASAYLVAWGEQRRAQAFLLRLAEIVPDPTDRAIAARLAAGFGLPETAVGVARKAGRDGTVLIDAGWPQPVQVPPNAGVDPALALGVIRQESSFDTATVSPANAQGLMQLLPGTAAEVARKLGMRGRLPSLTGDPAVNIELGSAYLAGLMDQFDRATPLAVAAYNAGPRRVNEWLGDNGDPRTGNVAMLDWIELIPINETRNYVQRVVENEVVYGAKRGELTTHPLTAWLR